ncbi:uncharacterized protein LOC117182996 [Belonocnema kinseyi]|uniref:uncharacterized protein LOC117182996 n=1 Tax=Belonocnema kinseyi TaxID=2817044 RepID=UPI00143DFA0A|nr:uncharacterized protein LOC117182996 [Belonocnema kinseyi]
MDAANFSSVPTKIGKVIAFRGSRQVGQIASQERGISITMALAVNAEGGSIPPFFLFPRKNMQSCFMEDASPGAVGPANGSGWMQQPEFAKFMEHFIERSKSSLELQTFLLLENQSSHLFVEALEMANNNGVTLLCFPPHCSHKLQPFNVSVYRPVKTYYKSQYNAWQKIILGNILKLGTFRINSEPPLTLHSHLATSKLGFDQLEYHLSTPMCSMRQTL